MVNRNESEGIYSPEIIYKCKGPRFTLAGIKREEKFEWLRKQLF